jgi:hypothetical protein
VTDRELLELAAKAAGYTPDGTFGNGLLVVVNPGEATQKSFPFQPLTDDGDALRLAVSLRMDIKQWNSLAIAAKAWNKHAEENTTTQCPYAATRRAIVRAAAEIGKAMP